MPNESNQPHTLSFREENGGGGRGEESHGKGNLYSVDNLNHNYKGGKQYFVQCTTEYAEYNLLHICMIIMCN